MGLSARHGLGGEQGARREQVEKTGETERQACLLELALRGDADRDPAALRSRTVSAAPDTGFSSS